jgi:hypothetical protein
MGKKRPRRSGHDLSHDTGTSAKNSAELTQDAADPAPETPPSSRTPAPHGSWTVSSSGAPVRSVVKSPIAASTNRVALDLVSAPRAAQVAATTIAPILPEAAQPRRDNRIADRRQDPAGMSAAGRKRDSTTTAELGTAAVENERPTTNAGMASGASEYEKATTNAGMASGASEYERATANTGWAPVRANRETHTAQPSRNYELTSTRHSASTPGFDPGSACPMLEESLDSAPSNGLSLEQRQTGNGLSLEQHQLAWAYRFLLGIAAKATYVNAAIALGGAGGGVVLNYLPLAPLYRGVTAPFLLLGMMLCSGAVAKSIERKVRVRGRARQLDRARDKSPRATTAAH